MSDFKFACPVCGQHITCDSTRSGTKLPCPTCFQELIVPQAAQNGSSKLILTAAQVSSRPLPQEPPPTEAPPRRPSSVSYLPFALLVCLICLVAGALYAFRGRIFSSSPLPDAASTATNTLWRLSLAGVAIPNEPVTGRISGRDLPSAHAIAQGGTLTFRHRREGQPETALTLSLPVRTAEELANRHFSYPTNVAKSPAALLRWRDKPEQRPQRYETSAYALQLQFGPVTEGRLPGKIYFCAFDAAKSWVAGGFEAEIRPPEPPRPQRPRR